MKTPVGRMLSRRGFSRVATLAIHSLLILGAVAVSPWAQAQPPQQPQELPWKVGVATRVVTPQESVWMAGYAARDHASEGKIHDLFAKAIYFEDLQSNPFVVVTLDLIGVPAELRETVAKRLEQKLLLPGRALLLNASHTHCGPELRVESLQRLGISEEYQAKAKQYLDRLAEQIVSAILEAHEKRQPAKLIYSRGRAGFAMNRRLPTAGGVRNSPNPDGPVDHDVPVLQVRDDKNRLRAVLFGYACHNTTLSFYQFCGDYAGFAQAYLEEDHPGVTAMFVMGCGADQNPYPRRTLKLAQEHGRALANGVEVALETLRTREVQGPLQSAYGTVELEFQPAPSKAELEQAAGEGNKYQRAHAQRMLGQLARDGKIRTQYDFPLQVVRFGDDLTLFAICGETAVDYARLLKETFRQAPRDPTQAGAGVWVAGYSNHVFGYLPSRRLVREGGYEGGGAMTYTDYPGPFTEDVEQRVVGKLFSLAEEIAVRPPAQRGDR